MASVALRLSDMRSDIASRYLGSMSLELLFLELAILIGTLGIAKSVKSVCVEA